MLVRFTIPIDNYYGDGVFEKHVYFECSRCPNLTEVRKALAIQNKEELELSIKNPTYGPFCFEYSQCLDALDNLERPNDFPCVSEGHLVQTNCFVNHPKWGRQPLTATIIEPIKEGDYASRHEEGDCLQT